MHARLLLLLAALGAATTPTFAQSVTLTDNGSTVVLSNGLVSATIRKSDATITTFTVGGSPNLAGSKGFYYTTHTVSGTTDDYLSLSSGNGATYSVLTNTSSMVDISIENTEMGFDATNFPKGMFDVDKHFVMRQGVSGIYTYIVWQHHTWQPTAYLYQQRSTEAETNFSGTYYAYSSPTTWNVAPSTAVLNAGTLITNAVYQLADTTTYTQPTGKDFESGWPLFSVANPAEMIGLTFDLHPVWTKYDWAVYSGPETSSLDAFGIANDQYGVWMLNGSQEYLNGGPTKLRGGAQQNSMDINTNENHGEGNVPDQPISAGHYWEKIYGPYLIYANQGSGHASLWQDAQNQGAQEVTAWPYSWLSQSESLYPRDRGTLTGKLSIPGYSAANAEIVVANKITINNTAIDWMFQGDTNYIYSTKADANGNFTVSKLRPDTYSVYAYVPGIIPQMEVDNVTVAAGGTTALGTVTWTPPHQQDLIFQLGTPDRSAGEFRFGNLPRQFGLWWRYLAEQGTSDLNYTVGTSTPDKDWYYAQMVVANSDGTYTSPRWNIDFNLAAIPANPATLTLALAGASGSGAFHVYVNGTDISPDPSTGIQTVNDRSIYRDAVTLGEYITFALPFDTSLLQVGENTISIQVAKSGSQTWTGTRNPIPAYGIMYDCVQLEAGPQVAGATSAPTLTP